MEVKRAVLRHSPHNLGKHSKSDDDTQIGFQCTQCLEEGLVAQLLGLQNGEAELLSRELDVALVHPLSTARRFVGRSYNSHNVVPLRNQTSKRRGSELWRTHKYNPQILSLHYLYLFILFDFLLFFIHLGRRFEMARRILRIRTSYQSKSKSDVSLVAL